MAFRIENRYANRPVRSVYRRLPGSAYPVHWHEVGWENAETVVMLHGLMAHSYAYRHVVDQLGARYHLVLPDLPAHGRDQSFRDLQQGGGVEALVAWLWDVLRVLQRPKVHLLGHSLGALLCFQGLKHAQIQPQIVSTTLISPGLQLGIPRWAADVLQKMPLWMAQLSANPIGMRLFEPIQWRGANKRMTAHELSVYLAPMRDRERFKFMFELMMDMAKECDRLRGGESIEVPTLILWGKKDWVLPVSSAPNVSAHIPGSKLVVLDDAGHCPMEDKPQQFVRIVEQFLSAGLEAPPTGNVTSDRRAAG